jgi:hypothetical protein
MTTDQTNLEQVDEAPEQEEDVAPEQEEGVVDDAETFPREYVVKLRDENAKYRQRAGQSDDLAHRLHLELVRATGRLADATDLVFDDAHLTDPAALVAAVEQLLVTKPHLANRKPTGDIGQGASGVTDTFSLSGLLRSGAR